MTVRPSTREDLPAIHARIDAQNEASLRLHADFGFERAAHFKGVGFNSSRRLDVV